MYPLATNVPKPLLPIANRPMISYQLQLLENVGFEEVIIITQASTGEQLKTFVEEIYEGKLNAEWEFLPDYVGTFEALNRIKAKLTTNFIVISCDLIVDEALLLEMIDFHRVNSSLATIMLNKSSDQAGSRSTKVAREYGLMDYFGVSTTKQLLYMAAAADVERYVRIPKTILQKHPNVSFETNLLDAHLYIFSRQVVDVFFANIEKNIKSIKGEFLPFLVQSQFEKKYTEDPRLSLAQHLAYDTSHGQSRSGSKKCYAFISSGYCSRANTNKSFLQMNKEIATRGACYQPREPLVGKCFVATPDLVSPKTQLGVDCVVGKETSIGERCSIKKSIIGKHCKIDSRVKVINSVIMDHVTIRANCTVINSIICNNVFMHPDCNIKDSQIGDAFTVEAKTEIKAEALCKTTEMMDL
eukprot:TRINITY_DN1143_c0_g1_i2.p1 TRINITY_DN1143_c0_g1~~TRINITY_DN1143_c0_g1_i2.p1  ORF type:complete len:413 (-),score=54.58 TRINITY_DN1143_c0_g1_i2:572-1810(-)